jgi:hypothetical protein
MTDNGSGYVAGLFRKGLRMLGIAISAPAIAEDHGKAKRSIQTLMRE